MRQRLPQQMLVLKFIRQENLPVFRWIELLRELEPPAGLRRLVDAFLDEVL